MMKNKNKILVGCLALLLVLSVGYALFSETITINGTAKAKGNFSIKIECSSIDANGNATGKCDVNGNKVTTTTNLTKPTEEVWYFVTLTNDGTIPIKLKSVSSPNNSDASFGRSGDCYYIDYQYYLLASYGISGAGVNTYCDSLINSEEIIINPSEELIIDIEAHWVDSKVMKTSGMSEIQPKVPANGAVLKYDIVFDFEQVTVN